MMNDSAADLDLCDLRANAEGYLCHACGGFWREYDFTKEPDESVCPELLYGA